MPLETRVCWLGSLGERVRLGKTKVRTAVAYSNHVISAMEKAPPLNEQHSPPAAVYALVQVQIRGCCTMMTDLEPHELEQVRFWSDVMVKDLFGHSYVFDILNLWKFDTPRTLSTGSLNYRGCIGSLPEGFHAMLLQRLPVDPSLPWAPQGHLECFFPHASCSRPFMRRRPLALHVAAGLFTL